MTRAKIGDTGTLEQLGGQADDVVEYCGSEYVVLEEPKPILAGSFWAGTEMVKWIDCTAECKLISRATPRIFDDMTDAEQGALCLAAFRGEPVELWNGMRWLEDLHGGDFASGQAYRVKPVVEECEEMLVLNEGVFHTHKLTYNRVDGEIDCASAVLVKL